ncbi:MULTISPECIES: iron ABC transporter permease [Muribaculaceae]|uniref:FecCD family ABC transporter permease n=1 Tax=Muribaculaceae TaxID=2005473 RepID=UPI00256FD34F|nr:MULTISPECIES: iron ABC transporter permease [Muribaculaceae]
MRTRASFLFIVLAALTLFLFMLDLSVGAVAVPLRDVWAALTGGDCPRTTAKIILNIRLIKAVVALLAGAALSVSGLQMQTLFRNPLAGPYVLGISSGASLGVALFILGAPLFGLSASFVSLGIAGAAWIGAAAVLIVIAAVGHRIKDIMVILILGMMFSSGVGAIVQILQYLSKEESLKAFVIWTMGSLGDVTLSQIYVLVPAVMIGLAVAVITIKPLNLLLFGEEYAVTMGLNIRSSRGLLFLSTTLLAGTATAFCGPIGFIGLAMPHVTRMLFDNSDHRILIPGTVLTGASVLLLCDLVSKLFTLPVNAITALLGIPVVVWVVLRNKSVTA